MLQTNNWNDETVRTMIELWNAGHSAEEIACKLHIESRNAVIGKIYRLRRAGYKIINKTSGHKSHAFKHFNQDHRIEAKNLNHKEDIEEFFRPETFGKGFL